MLTSNLGATMARIADQSAEAIGDFLRSNNGALNRHIRRALSAPPGRPGSLLADPVIEVAQDWAPASETFGAMAGKLLDERLVRALDQAARERMPASRKPYLHQVRAWEAAGAGHSVLVSSGTGSGKTECFMIPILNDILREPHVGGGIRAIIVYPLNALIQSQRDRLSAWAEGLGGKVSYVLYNGDTPEKNSGTIGALGEVLDRKSLREKPPSILVTNITMLEYMLLRAEDQSILKKSQGLLRWIVLDEAHSYVGAQASEMAMLLRRVRAAFGVEPENVRLMATSATIEDDTGTRLSEFMQGLSGAGADKVTVIQGEAVEAPFPEAAADTPLDLGSLKMLPDDAARWEALAPHPRIQALRPRLKSGLTLGEIALHAFGRADAHDEAETLLDLVAQACATPESLPLLRWRGHLFLRALGGAWACLDPACPHAAAELRDGEWPFGQVHFTLRERCTCGAPCMELAICNDCGTPHLKAQQEFGAQHRLVLPQALVEDDYATDIEEDGTQTGPAPQTDFWVTSAATVGRLVYVNAETLEIFSNLAELPPGHLPLRVVDAEPVCPCSETRDTSSFKHLRFSPAYLMGQNMQTMIEAFSLPDSEPAAKPLAGRGAISFTDSRQGVARLAAKLQAEAERSLTRSFLWHEVQAAQTAAAPLPLENIARLRQGIQAMLAIGDESTADLLQSQLDAVMAQTSATSGVKWNTAVSDLAGHPELGLFVREVWKDRGDEFVNQNEALAQVLLMREIMRRPVRQNNAETMGLARLAFPALERAVLEQELPLELQGRGVTKEDYLGLVLSAVDLFFREKMVVALQPEHHMRWIAPKWGQLRKACSNNVAKEDRLGSEAFPTALVPEASRMHRVALNALALTGGARGDLADLEDADGVLRKVYQLIVWHACKLWTQNAVALDFSKAEIQPYRKAWLCPLSRRVFAYAIKGCSPLDATRPMTELLFPTAPLARRGGLMAAERSEMAEWLAKDLDVARLREQKVWTGLHNRAVLYSPYMRAQEHSAQLARSQLKEYEKAFNEGQINLLACSTTMEMGVDLSNVGLVVNSNVPPSVSNYRQRVGRAGRRREPWAFGVTWCRDMPLDNQVFEEPRRLLHGRMAAPRVTLNSPILMARHVNAAAFAGWVRGQGGMKVMDKIGPFFGMDAEGKIQPDAAVDRFLAALNGPEAATLLPGVETLLRGSCLEGRAVVELARQVAGEMKRIVDRWRGEYKALVQRGAASSEADVSQALKARAANMHGAYLLSELSKEGFTPAYGFPSDVVTFDHIGKRRGQDTGWRDEMQGRGGASRTLDVALREYAPGSDLVINGLVYTSEGIRPAWSSQANASHLEDLRQLCKCSACGKPHLARDLPEVCSCGASLQVAASRKTLRPVGFVGRSEPHIGYELLKSPTFRMPEISADDAAWSDLPGGPAFRLRATAKGQVITLGSGEEDAGYAICLVCGRAASEHTADAFGKGPLPAAMDGHRPLISGPKSSMVSGRCIGGEGTSKIQRHVHLVHDRMTDVFEMQMPQGTTQGTGLAFAAALREVLSSWLGVDAEEIGLATGISMGADQSRRVSAYLFDRAAGGAGLSLRLGEEGRVAALISKVVDRLECPEGCSHGCPACILRPDMNMAQVSPNRPAAAELAGQLRNLLRLDPRKQTFGPKSVVASQPLVDLINQQISQGTALALTIFARGRPDTWSLSEWPILSVLTAWRQSLPVQVVFQTEALQDPKLDVATRMQLLRIADDGGIHHRADLPQPRLMPLLAAIRTAEGLIGAAAASPSEAHPDAEWGRGKVGLLVTGPIKDLPELALMPVTELLPQAEPGKSAYAILGARTNVALPGFGRAFWSIVEADAPALYATLAKEGVEELRYDDRYFRKPLHFQLLREILLAAPGRTTNLVFRLYTLEMDPIALPGQVDHNLSCDDDRQTLFDELFPGDRLAILPMSETEHARSLTLKTTKGSKVIIYFDQGMDLWRLTQRVSTVHGRDMGKLAAELEKLNVTVAARSPSNPTLFLCRV
ncbi:DEAD/DEAH box helicase [Rhodobacter sp. CZR27]|uniref:DEAD/DEAH box helicase n=1 Tax=Rhodobacter sp. CZR27 TaxID=2033869 RepID=UPI000BBEDFF3|nr:DEAD/DEAH box helicase [Rhodobacter sp. CZR27]